MNEEMKETGPEKPDKKEKKPPEMESRRAIMLIVAGIYLVYLAVKILTGLPMGSAESRMVNRVIPIAASILFIVAGIWTVVRCARALIAQQKNPQEEEPEASAASAEPEEPKELKAPEETIEEE